MQKIVSKTQKFGLSHGFTLIELVVSISVIAMLTGIMLANYRGGGIKTDLTGYAQKAVSDVRVAQNYSLATREFNGAAPIGGWGVHFDISKANQYIIFADKDGDGDYDQDETYSTSTIPSNMEIGSMNQTSPVDVVFLPPDPKTIIKANGVKVDSLLVALKEKINNSTKSFQINFLGLIDVID